MPEIGKYRILIQIFLWWGLWLFISMSIVGFLENPEWLFRKGIPPLIGIAIVVFVNLKFLIPEIYLKKNILLFILSGMIVVGIAVFLLHFREFPWSELFEPPRFAGEGVKRGRPPGFGFRWVSRATPLIMAFLGSSIFEISWYSSQKDKELIRYEKESLESELKFLKSQINPHFLFNALNNIYSLSVTSAPQTSESIMQLSEILRYMVYDSNEVKVPLKKEINYIENFVELKMLKDSRGMDVKVELDKSSPEMMIPPLLFIPFVENAFKHSKIENLDQGFIRVSLQCESVRIIFQVINSLPPIRGTKDKIGGVGLSNIRKRLDLLYNAYEYNLDIIENSDTFETRLEINAL